MANAAQPMDETQDSDAIAVYTGSPRNLALGVAFAVAGGMSFMMGMTDVFFARATAWTFVIWGILFLLVGLADMAQTYIVRDEALEIKNAIRIWDRDKYWEWANIYRADVVVTKPDARLEDANLQIYHQQPGEIAIEREDRDYLPELARQVIELAGLAPDGDDNPQDLTVLPPGKAVYTWK